MQEKTSEGLIKPPGPSGMAGVPSGNEWVRNYLNSLPGRTKPAKRESTGFGVFFRTR